MHISVIVSLSSYHKILRNLLLEGRARKRGAGVTDYLVPPEI